MILAIETSCDDTCAAVVDGARVLSNVISSQAAAHERYGGVVPRWPRATTSSWSTPWSTPRCATAGVGLEELDARRGHPRPGPDRRPAGRASAPPRRWRPPHRLPLIPVDHLQGHVAANFLEPEPLEPPFLCLIASGGPHAAGRASASARFEMLGSTLDDAAGEAFDKGARLLGLGYPGGPAIERAGARMATPPPSTSRSRWRDPGLDFSFSGLKTALALHGPRAGRRRRPSGARADLAASYQRGDRRVS